MRYRLNREALCAGCLVALLVLMRATLAAADWPQWRGPTRDGRTSSFQTPPRWPEQLVERWRVDVGEGHSSPVVVGNKVFLFSRRDEQEVLAAINLADGKELWQHGYAAPYQVNPVAATHGKGPKSTPAVADGRVFTLGISGIVTAWDAQSGKTLWQREFSKQFPQTSPLYGAAMSPAIAGDKCIVHVGGHDKGALLALAVKTGETLWSWNDDGPGYASPLVVTLDGVPQVITQSQKACIGVGLEKGELLWRIPFTTEYDQNSVTPLEYEGSVIFSGINKGVERYRIEEVEEEWETDKLWSEKEASLYMSSPVADGERLFGFSHKQKGQLFALDLTTGKVLWTSGGRLGETAALVLADKVCWALTTAGELIAFAASDRQFEQLARYQVAKSPTWAHPALLAGGVLVKDETHLTYWQFPRRAAAPQPAGGRAAN
jgi:outer membrane protein assembly factor BamB